MSATTGTRRCARCGMFKPIDEFALKGRSSGTRRSYCRPCSADYGRSHYQHHRAQYIARARSRRPLERKRVRNLVSEYLATHPCVDCSERNPVVLEFDHRDHVAKSHDVSRLVSSGSWAAVLREIAKCEVRCANCHRLRTARQFAWLARREQGGVIDE